MDEGWKCVEARVLRGFPRPTLLKHYLSHGFLRPRRPEAYFAHAFLQPRRPEAYFHIVSFAAETAGPNWSNLGQESAQV